MERYGGPEGMQLAEQLFHADSEAVAGDRRALDGDEGADARWRLALRAWTTCSWTSAWTSSGGWPW